MAPSLEEPTPLVPTTKGIAAAATTGAGEPKSSKSPLPPVLEFDAKTCTSAQLVDALKVSGGVIIRNMLAPEEIRQIEADVRPWLDKDVPWEGDFFPPETRRAFGLVSKSETFALRVVGNELYLGVVDALLTSELKYNWVGEKNEATSSKPQLNNTIVFSIGPGARDQALHRDDQIHHQYHPAVAEHHLGRDAGIGFFIAGKRTTRANGATRFIPGSHLWDYAEGPPREDQCAHAELAPGDGLMVLSGAFHGGSANTTADEERLVFSCFYTRSWMRQEENQYLANDWDRIRALPDWLQERVGWGLSRPFLGWVNLSDPMKLLHPERETNKDLF
ncbi:Phytanoyl-CoA dioxygenase family protein [Pleurostoma richardsiae]|uniref:Phytanoyl-CoA dioxygenase family protein n=1 Tax=Pleurostoma richardsiae TaxID=41990 RepID=A0AA38R8Z6_9PEZI|nr:Phytanoyl-CoA dioxygenase family protein [Pleurostoma richardsiae]